MLGKNIIKLRSGDIDMYVKTLSRLVRALSALKSVVEN